MDNAFFVGVVQRIRELGEQSDPPPRWQRPSLAEYPAQGLPLDQLHRDTVEALRFGDVVDLDDMGMAQRGGEVGLSLEALDKAFLAGQLRRQYLYGAHMAKAAV
jgi:hypothetical protein